MPVKQNNLSQDITAVRQAIESHLPQTWLITKKEIIANIGNFKIPAAIVVLTVAFLVSAHLMALDYRHRFDNWNTNQISQRDSIVGGSVRYELSDGSFSYATGIGPGPPILPPQPLSALVKGMDGEINRTVSLTQRIVFGARQDEPATSGVYDLPDTSFVIKLLVSLFALLFSLDAVTREKEAGTLRAMLALPIRRQKVFLFKLLAASFSLLLSFAIAYFSEIAFLHFAHGLIINRESLLRAMLIFCLGALYGIGFVQIGLFISTVAARTWAANTTALFAWVTIVLVLPNAAVLVAKLISPAPSYNQFNARLYEAKQQILQTETPSGSQDSKQTKLRIFDLERRMTDDYLASKKRQIHQAQIFASSSPAGALTFGLSDLAATGVSAYGSYLEFLRTSRNIMFEALTNRMDLPPQAEATLMQKARENVAGRQRHTEALGVSLRSASISVLSLLAWAILSGLAAYRRFERCDVR